MVVVVVDPPAAGTGATNKQVEFILPLEYRVRQNVVKQGGQLSCQCFVQLRSVFLEHFWRG